VKLVGSWKLESGVDKGDVREKKKGDLKNIEKKKIVKHERGIVIILTFEFEYISRLLF
jgi:hypothetical protein